MQSQQIPFYYDSVNTSGIMQAAAAGGLSRNIMIPTGSSSGAATPGLPSFHYPGAYSSNIK